MKIFLISIQYPPNVTGGGGIVVKELSYELAKSGEDVTVLTIGLKDKAEENIEIFDNNVKSVIKVKRFFTSDSKVISNPYEGTKRDEFRRFEELTEHIFEYIKDKDGTIHLHGHYIIPAMAKRIKEEGKKNFTLVTFSALESVALLKKEIKDDYALNYIKEREEVGLKHCDYAIVNAKKVKIQLLDMYPNSKYKNKIVVMPNYVAKEVIWTKKHSNEEILNLKRKYSLHEDNKIIFHIGRIDEIKGIEYLMEAMRIISAHLNLNISAVIAGFLEAKQKDYYLKLLDLAKKIMEEYPNIEIKFIPNIDYQDKIAFFDACVFFVTPAIVEPFGLTTLEAWAREKAVIRSDNEGTHYLFNLKKKIKSPFEVKDKGLIVNFELDRSENLAAAILWLLKNNSKAINMGKLGKKTVLKKYFWKRKIKDYRKLYSKAKV